MATARSAHLASRAHGVGGFGLEHIFAQELVAASSDGATSPCATQVISPVQPRPTLYGPFGMRVPALLGKLLARLHTHGLLRTLALLATYVAGGAASVPLTSQLWLGPQYLREELPGGMLDHDPQLYHMQHSWQSY